MKTQAVANILKLLNKKLPHGSGIDCNWVFSIMLNGSVRASNSFHCMDENGCYDGYADFTLIFKRGEPFANFVLNFNGSQAQYLNKKYMLRDYLEDTIHYSLTKE